METGEITKDTVDNKGQHYYSAEIRAMAKALGKPDSVALSLYQGSKISAFETKSEAEKYLAKKTRKYTAEDEENWRKRVHQAQKRITYENY